MGTPRGAAAQAWINYLRSDAGQAILARYGFIRSQEP
jgi:ABC-type molybdate transport system substrate-binding protein